MKKLSILTSSAFSTLAYGILIVFLSHLIIPDHLYPGLGIYFLIVNVVNFFITGFVHVFIYIPLLKFRSEESIVNDRSLTLYLFIHAFIFVLFAILFGVVTEGDWANSENALLFTAAFTLLLNQGLSAHLLHKKLKTESIC